SPFFGEIVTEAALACTAYSAPPAEDRSQNGSDSRRQAGALIEIAQLLNRLGLSGITVDRGGESAEAEAIRHGKGNLTHHFAGMSGHDGRCDDAAGPFANVNS